MCGTPAKPDSKLRDPGVGLEAQASLEKNHHGADLGADRVRGPHFGVRGPHLEEAQNTENRTSELYLDPKSR